MSQETRAWLAENVLVGMTDKRGTAWHWRAGDNNHYPGPIPVEDIRRRLFHWEAVPGDVSVTVLGEQGVGVFQADDKQGWVRPDTGDVLGIHSKAWLPHQYGEWLLDGPAKLLDADLVCASAGLLKRSRVAWVGIELQETLTAAEGVQFRPVLTGATSMDGSLATTYITGAILPICDNTLSAALNSADTQWKVRHTSRSLGRLNEAREALGIVYALADDFAAEVEALTARIVTDAKWAEFVQAYTFPGPTPTDRSKSMAERQAGELHRLWKHDPRVAPWAGSEWGVVQAVSTYNQHLRTVRGAERAERNMLNVLNGKAGAADQHVLDLLARV